MSASPAPALLPRFLYANGLEFALIEALPPSVPGGRSVSAAPLVLCLHGFPDSLWSYSDLLPRLATAGFRAVSVSMRGYLPGALPAQAEYGTAVLARDVIALIDHLGAQQAVVIGHDWGAVAAYAAAALRPDRVRALVTAAIPHLRRFLLRPTLAQLARSSYLLKFQRRGIEAALMADNCRKLKQLAQTWSPSLDVEQALAPVWAAFSDPARLHAALAYYRALPGDLLSAETWKLVLQPTPVPACVIYGDQDGCVGPEIFVDQAHLFAAGVRFECLAGAGHFMQLEQPEKFAAVVLSFLQGLPPSA